MIMIKLEFEKTFSAVSGSDFGERIFKDQVRDKINYEDMNCIEFDDRIKVIGISFVQGFTKEILSKINLEDFDNHFMIKGNERAVTKFYKALHY